MKILLEVEGSHHSFEEWRETQHYCMDCGRQTVWAETFPSDDESPYICAGCGWVLGGLSRPYVLRQIRAGVTDKPTTPTLADYRRAKIEAMGPFTRALHDAQESAMRGLARDMYGDGKPKPFLKFDPDKT